MTIFKECIDVPVDGGTLHVALCGDRAAPTAIAAHGITGSHHGWARVAAHVGDRLGLIVPDLRGRGGSADLPEPFGMKAHAADLIAVLDHLGAEQTVAAGHSMGGFVAATLAATYPERVSAVVLVDGGLPIAAPDGLDPDTVLDAVLGPAIARLRQEFASVDEYVAFWRAHPAFADSGVWNDEIETWVRSDLTGEPPALRSVVAEAAVRVDGAELIVDPAIRGMADEITAPMWLLRAPLGLFQEPNPLLPESEVQGFVDRHPGVQLTTVEDVNHYTLLLDDRGAAAVADAMIAAATRE